MDSFLTSSSLGNSDGTLEINASELQFDDESTDDERDLPYSADPSTQETQLEGARLCLAQTVSRLDDKTYNGEKRLETKSGFQELEDGLLIARQYYLNQPSNLASLTLKQLDRLKITLGSHMTLLQGLPNGASLVNTFNATIITLLKMTIDQDSVKDGDPENVAPPLIEFLWEVSGRVATCEQTIKLFPTRSVVILIAALYVRIFRCLKGLVHSIGLCSVKSSSSIRHELCNSPRLLKRVSCLTNRIKERAQESVYRELQQARIAHQHGPPTNLKSHLSTNGIPYQQLDFANFATRFLKILTPATDEDSESIVRCRLVHSSLIDTSTSSFTALSYRWGEAERTADIMVDGYVCRVTRNLEAAMKQLRKNGDTLVWADAVCINQDDNFERSNQVSRMGLIYSTASKVVIWLGNSDRNSQLAMEILQGSRRLDDLSAAADLASDAKEALETLLSNPYFERVWIIQEIAKASVVDVWCGNFVMEWEEFATEISRCKKTFLRIGSDLDIDSIHKIQHFRESEKCSRSGLAPRMLLSEALIRTSSARSTEPRDKLYGLLGLASDSNEVVPTPNYTQNDADVFKDASRFMIENQGQLALILLAGVRRSYSGGPTWLPDWTPKDPGWPPWIVQALSRERRLTEPRRLLKRNQLEVSAFKYGEILSEQSARNHKRPATSASPAECQDVLVQVCSLLNLCGSPGVVDHLEKINRSVFYLAALWTSSLSEKVYFPNLMSWYTAHNHVVLRGRPFSEWVSQYIASNCLESLDDSTAFAMLHPYELCCQSLKVHSMKLLPTNFSPVIAHEEVEAGDCVFQIEQLPICVALRPTHDNDTFMLKGEVLKTMRFTSYVDRARDGERITIV